MPQLFQRPERSGVARRDERSDNSSVEGARDPSGIGQAESDPPNISDLVSHSQ